MSDKSATEIRIDIVSDVVCPWCIVAYRQLEQALAALGLSAQVIWHPFELNPDMPEEGEDLSAHMARKYGATQAQSEANRARLAELGAGLGITFRFSETSRIVNTFKAHQLLEVAGQVGVQHALKLALFEAYFSAGLDVSQSTVLCEIAATVGMDRDACHAVLEGGALVEGLREKQRFWTSRGVQGVPLMIIAGEHVLSGAQGVEAYADVLRRVAVAAGQELVP